jgi:hypothetical protein
LKKEYCDIDKVMAYTHFELSFLDILTAHPEHHLESSELLSKLNAKNSNLIRVYDDAVANH